MTTTNAHKNCVILYSRRHFNPNSSTELSESSAGRIASTIYNAAKSCTNYSVTYFDSFDFNEWEPKEVDVLITLIDNLPLASWFFHPQKIVVIAVNQHPLERLKNGLLGLTSGLPKEALVASDGIFQPYSLLRKVNTILCVGNTKTLETYRKYLPFTDIRQVNYDSAFSAQNRKHKISQVQNILVLMSSIGFRKGFDRFADEIMNFKNLGIYTFHIVGHPENSYWRARVNELVAENLNVKFHGWLLNNERKFSDLLESMDVAIFPTREEGLVGSLLECIDFGIISLHTSNSGLDNPINELALPESGELYLEEKLGNLSRKNSDELRDLHLSQINAMKNQFDITSNIGSEIVSLLTQGIPLTKRTSKIPLLREALSFKSNRKNIPVLMSRLRLIQVRNFKSRTAIRFPSLFKMLKKIRQFLRY